MQSPPPSDHELMCRLQNRDASAFDTLAGRYRESLGRRIGALLRVDAAAVPDVLQETLLRVWTRAETWNGRGAVKAWLFRIAANGALNHLRTRRRRAEQVLPPEEADDEDFPPAHWWEDNRPGPEEMLLRSEERRRVRGLVGELSEEKREALRLFVDEERTTEQIGEALGVPAGTVKSRLHHARRILGQKLREGSERE